MQGNKKQTDGQSDSSSIGSLVDDTDREVCNLTARAFKSLCVAEPEPSYTELDFALSSNISHHFPSKLFHGPQNYVIRENADSFKQQSKTEEHSTFQQFPNNAQEDKIASTNNTPNIRRNLGLPMPGLRSYKHTSKVSSLIKTFDKGEKQPSPEIAKQSVQNNLTECPLFLGDNMWGSKAILKIQKELSGFSDTCQDMANTSSKHGIHKRQSKMDLVCPHSFYFSEAENSKYHISPVSRKTMKNRSGKAKEPIRRGRFLHSENSAFESWNAHHKKLTKVDDTAEIITKGRHLTYFEEAPFLQQSKVPEHKLSPPNLTPPQTVEDISNFSQKYEASLSPSALTYPLVTILSKTRDTDSQNSLLQASDLPAYAYKIPISPSLAFNVPFPPALNPHIITSPVSISKSPMSPPLAQTQGLNAQTLVPEMTLLPEKANSSENNPGLENVCPPWRKQKAALMGMELAKGIVNEVLKERDSSYRKPSGAKSLLETTTIDSQVVLSDPSSSNLRISELLTPAIPPKEEKEPPEDPLLLINSLLSEVGTTRESEERATYCSQNNYKSKAPSLLFNLKDIRKRVKSTYSPSPLLKALEDKKKIKELDNMKANVIAVNQLEECSEKLLDYDERSHQPSEQMDRIQGKDNTANINGNYLIWNAPKSKADAQHYQNRQSSGRGGSVDVSEGEVVFATELYPDEHIGSYCPLPSNSYFADVTSDQQMYMQSLHLQGPKHGKNDLSQNADVEPQVFHNLFFTAEENMINNENQVCLLTENEQKGTRSTSSSEHSFVSIIDQPYQNEAPYSLMQLFQKACLHESQRKKNSMSGDEKLSSKERDMSEKKKELDDYFPNDYDSNRKMENTKKEEQNEIDNGVQKRVVNDKEEGWENMDSASEDKSEEPLSPISSNSFKPNLFMIKDNTFKSPAVIKAVKLPLLRSISCEDTLTVNQGETEKQRLGPNRATPNNQEMDLSVSRKSSKQNVNNAGTESEASVSSSTPVSADCQVAQKGIQTAEYALTEGQGSDYVNELIRGDGRTSITSVLSQKDLENNDKLTKARTNTTARKQKMSSTNQPNLGLEDDQVKRKQISPIREETSSLNNNVFSKCRGGSCEKKIIRQETGSVMAPENQTSPGFSDAFGDMTASGNLASSTLPSPRSDSMGPSAFTSPLSDATATSNVSQVEKIKNSPLLQKATDKHAMETANSVETSQHYGDARRSPVFNGRQSLMGRMVKTADKPPAVPPKTEKALRRAKKLANRRGKIEAQQKKAQAESTSQCTDTAHSQLIQFPIPSPVCPNSPLIPSKSTLKLKSMPSLKPTPSLPDTQRKLLQDPVSGEYFIIDLPIQLKTFYDPETGRYVQVSISPSSSELPSSAFVLHPCPLPLRVSSVPAMASPSQFSESASLMQGTLSTSDWPPADQYPEPQDTQPCIESAVSDSHSQDPDRLQQCFEKDVGLSANADISTGAIGDFAVEGIL